MKTLRPISTRHNFPGHQDGWHSPTLIIVWEVNVVPERGREYTWTCSCGASNQASQKAEQAARTYNTHMMSRTQDHLYTLKPEALKKLHGYHRPHKHPAPHSMGSAIWDPIFPEPNIVSPNTYRAAHGLPPAPSTPSHDFHGRRKKPLIDTSSTPAPAAPHQTAHTITKQIRQPNPANWQTFGAVHHILNELEKSAEEMSNTILPTTIRLEARPNHGGTELTIQAFSKPQ